MSRALDLILFGATGFTGRLIAEVLQGKTAAGDGTRWALAGRSSARLQALRQDIGAAPDLPLLQADASDAASLAKLVAQARLVISTVGPYQRHGEALVRACAEAGTDYVDLCGEPAWMAHMVRELQAPAEASGARIVFSCGFDSIPFDLGVLMLQSFATAEHGAPLQRVRGRVKRIKGGPSGGTVASLLATVEAMQGDPEAARLMADPFALTPGFRGPPQPDGDGALFDDWAGAWTGPFVMATINTKNVHRSNQLRGHPWGQDFEYDERMTARNEAHARRLARQAWWQNRLLGVAPLRALLRHFVLPKPGQGPDRRQREAGKYDLVFQGRTADGVLLQASVSGDRDPGYGSTSRMIVEAALCLLHDVDHAMTPGGVWTPASAMGLALVRRLQAHAGLEFKASG